MEILFLRFIVGLGVLVLFVIFFFFVCFLALTVDDWIAKHNFAFLRSRFLEVVHVIVIIVTVVCLCLYIGASIVQ